MPECASPSIKLRIIWHAFAADGPGVEELAEVLDSSEQERLYRLHQETDRWSFAAAHALLRKMLSDRYGGPPRSWRFARDGYDRPHLDRETHAGVDPAFSLSHTRDLAVCALADTYAASSHTKRLRVGIDAEARTTPHIREQLIAGRFFAPSEVAFLRNLDPARRRRAFLDLWTLKEAVAKAVGLGLSMNLATFACRVAPPSLETTEPALLPIESWTLSMLDVNQSHAVAVAVKHSPRESIRIHASGIDGIKRGELGR